MGTTGDKITAEVTSFNTSDHPLYVSVNGLRADVERGQYNYNKDTDNFTNKYDKVYFPFCNNKGGITTNNEGGDEVPSKVTLSEYREQEKAVREIMKTEITLIDSRMNWFFAFQGLLLTAAAFSKDQLFLQITAAPGMLGCFSTFYSVTQARRAILKMEHFIEKARNDLQMPYVNRFPTSGLDLRDKGPFHSVFMPSSCMPLAMIITWFSLAIWVDIGAEND